MAEIGKDINRAAEILKDGALVAIPTETVYGLAGNALNPTAITAIYTAKKRPQFNPLIAHIGRLSMFHSISRNVSSLTEKLIEAFWPGPLTVLVPKQKEVPDLLTSGHEKVGVRMPRHPLTLNLLEQLDFPLAAPSANPMDTFRQPQRNM